tara:strand:- start:110 stop:457 length:348 start_codon:yes stop_codon:yes gene_type:complete
MPIYIFKHPTLGTIIEEVQKMSDAHVYVDADGTEWERVWTTPSTSIGLNSDADNSKQFVDKTHGWSVGDMWDYSKELSEKRSDKRGYDHVKDAHDKKRQQKIDEKKRSNQKKSVD